ncbi:MAG: aspartate/tyrosine/aromatic aminotransferase, partial [Propionibacteriaceae bacterium]|nr:aspartate/tyrosine/aromatic aminotransferase [Propionibacteriaceae bacterium]
DPILGVTDAFKADPRPTKVNLGVGIYQDDTGKLPLMQSVALAEARIAAHPVPRPYLSIDGNPDYDALTAQLVLGADSPALTTGASITVQTLGGSGALKVGGDFLRSLGATDVLVSDPTWDNHRPILTGAGLRVGTYRYYDAAARAVDFEGMVDDLRIAPPGTVVLLHGCCHNPTGYDLTPIEWMKVLDVVTVGQLIPFVDMAYQGFADGIDQDALAIRSIARRGLTGLCSNSFSKTFGLYGERVGGLTLITASADEAARVRSQVKLKVRANYSNPPTHGEAIVNTILADDELRAIWVDEVAGMRDRIKAMRAALVDGLKAQGITDDLSFITNQRGMFSYMGLGRPQMVRLREEFGVYGVESGRLCVAALNPSNVEYVAKCVAAVMAD